MKCPFCEKELSRGELKKYSDTSDHVFDPNNEYGRPERITFVCDCELSSGSFWDGSGGWYMGNVEYKVIHEWKNKNNKSTHAIGSWDEWFNNKTEFSHFVYKFLIFSKGNNRFFLSYKISDFFYKWFVPKPNIIFE